LDKKTKQRIIKFFDFCDNIQSQVSPKFKKIQLRYIWILSGFIGTAYVLSLIPNSLNLELGDYQLFTPNI
jgi:hypothetical protein